LEKTRSKKDSVDFAVNNLTKIARETTEAFSKLVQSSLVSSESVASNIDQIVLSLQFQDITRQEIDAALSPLKQIGGMAQDMMTKGRTLKGNAAAVEIAKQSVVTRQPTEDSKKKEPEVAFVTPEVAAVPAAPTPAAETSEETTRAISGEVLFF
jgi:hypothetical protein